MPDDWKTFFDELVNMGFTSEYAQLIVDTIRRYNLEGMPDEELDQLTQFYTDRGWEAQQAALGGRRQEAEAKTALFFQSPEQQEVQRQAELRRGIQSRYGTTDPEMLKMLGEQQAIIAGEDIRQQKAGERYAAVEERAQKMVPQYPAYNVMTSPFIEGASEAVSPRFRQWAESELPGMYNVRAQEEFREQQLAAARRIGLDYYQAWSDEPGGKEEKRGLKALVERKSPWEELLAQPSFLKSLESRFRALPARERGYFSSQFKPRTRFLG